MALPDDLFGWFADSLSRMGQDGIAPSEQEIVRRILSKTGRVELAPFFERLVQHMPVNVAARLVDMMIGKVLIHGPEGWSDIRAERRDVEEALVEIGGAAEKLARAVERLSRLQNEGGLVLADTDLYSIFAVIEGAAVSEGGELWYCYRHYLKESLDGLLHRFDGKYYPSVPQVVRHIARTAENANVAVERSAEAATSTRQRSIADVVRSIVSDLHELGGALEFPPNVNIRDSEMAAFLSVTTEKTVTEEQVRKRREEFEKSLLDNSAE